MSNKASNPIPQGKYVPANRVNNLIFTSGMTPRDNGILLREGPIMISDDISVIKPSVELATKNALTAAKNVLNEDEKIEKIVNLTVYLNCEDGFTKHASIGDIASNFLYEELGEKGSCARTTVGVHTLPSNAPVEIQLIVSVE
ncbi:MAG: RidA family protein [Tissierellia bacterium]|nr:RidA family protein [Tissierellia bacterium]